jgi:asparagine synthase (glutamine-hydrolysing)
VALACLFTSIKQPGGQAIAPQTRWAKLPEMVYRGDDLLALYQMAYAIFLPEFQQQLLGDTARGALVGGLPEVVHSRLRMEMQSRSPLSAISAMEQCLFLGERLLRDTDAASMAASIEVRLPLVDQVLLEAIDRLPMADRYHSLRAKCMLRRIGLRGLNPALFEWPKSGFVLPYDRWLRSGLGKMIDGTLRDADAIRPTGLNPAAVLQLLWQAFLDSARPLLVARMGPLRLRPLVPSAWCIPVIVDPNFRQSFEMVDCCKEAGGE